MSRSRLCALLSLLTLAGEVQAEEVPPPSAETAPAPKDGESPAAPPEETPAPKPKEGGDGAAQPPAQPPEESENWIDQGHAFIEHRVFAPILRLDRFFSDERDLDPERSRSFLRWRSELRVVEDLSRPAFTTGIRANLRLPGLNKQLERIRVVIEGETRDAVSSLFPRTPGPASPFASEFDEQQQGGANAGLRFFLWDSLMAHADLGGGVLLQLPPGVFGRLRLRYALPVGKLFLTRYAASGFWRTDTHLGTTGEAAAERVLTRFVIARLAGQATVTQVSVTNGRGTEWGTEAALVASFAQDVGAQVGVAATGATALPVTVERYRVYTRIRRDVYRRWLFVELEPEIAWPWTNDPTSRYQGRYRAWGLSFRLEVQFQGTEAPPRPAIVPVRPPEPKDPLPIDEPADVPPKQEPSQPKEERSPPKPAAA